MDHGHDPSKRRATGLYHLVNAPRAPGLTLLEALVAAGIISVLLAILLPALAGARRVAGVTTCQAGLSSINAGYGHYIADHQDLLPTHEYPRDIAGVADPILVPEWGDGGGGWIILPISEITFWGYLLRPYLVDDPSITVLGAIELLSCPVVYDGWLSGLPAEQVDQPQDPMFSPQRSFAHSVSLFTRAAPWNGTGTDPDVNAIHSPINFANVAFPSSKANLVEAAAHHERARTRLVHATVENFNILALDGHVERRSAAASHDPAGFVGSPTGFEEPPIAADEYAAHGLRFISTRGGHLGADW